MLGPSALDGSRAVEGAFVLGAYNVASSVVAGGVGGLRAGPNGVSMGRFGWADAAGIVHSMRTNASDVLGIVIPQLGPWVDWRRAYFDEVTESWKLREGMPLTMAANGTVWARFPFGARIGERVYANPLDGSAISGDTPGGELTPWSVNSNTPAGGLAIISTWSKYP